MSDPEIVELPREVSRATMKIGDLELEVVNLDNGQRLITAVSMMAFLKYLEGVSDATDD